MKLSENVPKGSTEQIGPEWLTSAAREAQVSAGAALEAGSNAGEVVAALAERIGEPQGPLERLFAAHLLQRMGWSVLQRQVRKGLILHSVAHEEFGRIIEASERGDWSQIPLRLRRVRPISRSLIKARQIREFLDTHFASKVTLVTVAREAGLSARAATDHFKRHYGMNIHMYLTRRRLVQAINLLLNTDMKMSAIAGAVGFRDKSVLHRHCIRVFRVTPNAIRRNANDIMTILNTIEMPPTE